MEKKRFDTNTGLLIILIIAIGMSAFSSAVIVVNEVVDKPNERLVQLTIDLRGVDYYGVIGNDTYIFRDVSGSNYVLRYDGIDLSEMGEGRYTFWITDYCEIVRYEKWTDYEL